PMAITVTVIANYSTGPESQNTPFKLAVVNERNSPVAHGWTLLGVQHLYAQSSDSAVVITEGDGSAEVWTHCVTSSCLGPVGEYSNLWFAGSFPGTTYTRVYPNQDTATFNNLGQLIRMTDPFHNNDSLAYDAGGRLVALYDPVRMNGSSRA